MKRGILTQPLRNNYGGLFQAWAESQGYKYFSAYNMAKVDAWITELVDSESEKPMLLEVYTDYDSDGTTASRFFASLDRRSFAYKVQGKLSRVAGKIFKN